MSNTRFRNERKHQKEMQTRFNREGKIVIQLSLACFIHMIAKGQATIDRWLSGTFKYAKNKITLWREYWRQSLS